MLYAVILFCALGINPPDCDEVSAAAYERVPGGSALPFGCFQQAEIWAAEHGLRPRLGEYMKVRCSRSEFRGWVG